ncbi:type II toxin-antitoxin system MqsA family antitoxin [Halospina sp. K52047b]|uniref:type II toxin-antitoxin system MqsA family antitoxin n=1 Tax=Halospina sp. K52047b TaxID=2614160 RepID=UPI001CE4327B|nr:type II toxin-antitoxin system MqsA family antitoxin [Halospina sp. K52047b]
MYECKACGSHDVTQHAENESIRYRQGAVDVALSYCVCNACGREFVPTEVIKQNDALIRAARRAYDGLLSPEQIRHGRQSLGLSQEEAASVFGGGANAFSKYERGEVTQSVAMDRLIRLCVNHPELLDEIRSGFHEVSTLS